MARTHWLPHPENLGLLPRPGRSDRHHRRVPKTRARPADRTSPGVDCCQSICAKHSAQPRTRRKRPPNDIGRRAYPQDSRSLLGASGQRKLPMVPHDPLARASQLLDVIEEAEHALLEQCRGAIVMVVAASA